MIICIWKSQRMGTSNLKLMLISWTWCSSVGPEVAPLFTISFECKKKKIKSWQVCDWLAKWLIMSGYMDLRRPRVYRRSNVGLVLVKVSRRFGCTWTFRYWWFTLSWIVERIRHLSQSQVTIYRTHIMLASSEIAKLFTGECSNGQSSWNGCVTRIEWIDKYITNCSLSEK